MNLIDISSEILKFNKGYEQGGLFWLYEPWDVGVRSDEVMAQAKLDNVEIGGPKEISTFGTAPRRFQSGIHLDCDREQVLLGPTKSGKTLAVIVEVVIQHTRNVPVCMQHELGVDSGVPREINEENIRRWGRRRDGEIIDHDWKALKDGTWDCGNVIGIGIYPPEKFSPLGSKIVVLTTRKALDEKWWPEVKASHGTLFPEGSIDASKGNDGFREIDKVVYFHGGRELHFITYDSGDQAFEATDMAWWAPCDEEPYNKDIWVTVVTHSRRRALIMTPYNGISWSKELVEKKVEGRKVYHAIGTDSPYLTPEIIADWRNSFDVWDIQARLYAQYTESSSRPFFDRAKIQAWMRSESPMYELVSLGSNEPWKTVDQLLKGETIIYPEKERDKRFVWEMYEKPMAGVAYLLTADTAMGAEHPDDAGDMQVAYIMRQNENEIDPTIVASCVSTLPIIEFARLCLKAAHLYNDAVLSPEMGNRGASNATFRAHTYEWPYWYKMTLMDDITRREKTECGFDTNARTRPMLFDLLKDFVARHNEDRSGIIHTRLLEEMSGCVIDSKGRPDHAKRTGSLDCVIAFGIGLYVFKYSRSQVTCNAIPKDTRRAFGRILDRTDPPLRASTRNPFARNAV